MGTFFFIEQTNLKFESKLYLKTKKRTNVTTIINIISTMNSVTSANINTHDIFYSYIKCDIF